MLHRLPFHAMGTDMVVMLESESDSTPQDFSRVPVWFEEWEGILSRFRLDSELVRMNRNWGRPVEVSATVWEVFEAARSADEWTNHLVTPVVLDALVAAGYDRSFDVLNRLQITPGSAVPIETQALSMVIADREAKTICLPAGMQLDFGGSAKGWAAQQTVARLGQYGPVLMNAGGDIAVSGRRWGDVPWAIGVANPFDENSDLDVLYVQRGGVATSGKDRRNWMQNGVIRHHLIDPSTGQPAVTDILRATIVAPSVMQAEAAAKAVVILGAQRGMEWIEADASLAGLLVLDDGTVLHSSRMHEYTLRNHVT